MGLLEHLLESRARTCSALHPAADSNLRCSASLPGSCQDIENWRVVPGRLHQSRDGIRGL